MAQHYDVIINSRDEKPLVHAGLLFLSILRESRNTVTSLCFIYGNYGDYTAKSRYLLPTSWACMKSGRIQAAPPAFSWFW